MHENAQGGFAGEFTSEVTLEELAHESAVAERIQMIRKVRTNRRHGNKGSRKWGFMEPIKKRKR